MFSEKDLPLREIGKGNGCRLKNHWCSFSALKTGILKITA
jgi:hypothetical protein